MKLHQSLILGTVTLLYCVASHANSFAHAPASVLNWKTPFSYGTSVPSGDSTTTVTIQNTGSCYVDVTGNGQQINPACSAVAPGYICSFYFFPSAGTVAIQILAMSDNTPTCVYPNSASSGTMEIDNILMHN